MAQRLAKRMIRSLVTKRLKRPETVLEQHALKEYCQIKNASYWPCGFVIHPDAPWLGCSPDGIVYDPTESPPFGLLDIKFPNVKSYVNCDFLELEGHSMTLNTQHSYFWQAQGQLLLSGMEWCDFVVAADEDMVIQRIYRDAQCASTIRERADHFFFNSYMCACMEKQ